jgi:hypothetical protein
MLNEMNLCLLCRMEIARDSRKLSDETPGRLAKYPIHLSRMAQLSQISAVPVVDLLFKVSRLIPNLRIHNSLAPVAEASDLEEVGTETLEAHVYVLHDWLLPRLASN